MNTPNTPAELLPCPFCGSEDIDPAGWMTSGGVTGPACDDCGASAGGAMQTAADNVAAWNRRAALATPQAHATSRPTTIGEDCVIDSLAMNLCRLHECGMRCDRHKAEARAEYLATAPQPAEATAEDAARYRWLMRHRLEYLARNTSNEISLWLPNGLALESESAISAAIDRARTAVEAVPARMEGRE